MKRYEKGQGCGWCNPCHYYNGGIVKPAERIVRIRSDIEKVRTIKANMNQDIQALGDELGAGMFKAKDGTHIQLRNVNDRWVIDFVQLTELEE